MSDFMVSVNDDQAVVTGYDMNEAEKRILVSAISNYTTKTDKQISVFTQDDTTSDVLTFDRILELARDIQSNLSNLLTANVIIRQQVLVDSLLGHTFECIVSNVNTDYTLNYPDIEKLPDKDDSGRKINEETFNEAKRIIEQFNDDIDISEIIRDAISIAYLEGNYPMILRIKNGRGIIDHYPLTLAYPSDYEVNRDSVLEFNIRELRTRLRKTYSKNKKNKPIYFEDMEREVAANYPNEVLKAYRDNEQKITLDPDYTGCIKINDMGRKFGVSPFFKCLRSLIILNNIEAADVAASKARSKKILYQKLRKELMGTNGNFKGFAEQAHAHEAAVNALNTNFGLYTSPAYVEDLSWVTDNSSSTDEKTIATYNSKMLTALGVGFVDTNVANYSVANISVDQLMRVIDSIGKQAERVLNKFYVVLLRNNQVSTLLAPKIKIAKSEQLSWELRKEFSSYLYTTLNGSLKTAMELVGLDVDEEKQRRSEENERNFKEIFEPRPTSYTTSGDSDDGSGENVGRPKDSDNKEKQESDENYNKIARK